LAGRANGILGCLPRWNVRYITGAEVKLPVIVMPAYIIYKAHEQSKWGRYRSTEHLARIVDPFLTPWSVI
jgi:hypothetical protein